MPESGHAPSGVLPETHREDRQEARSSCRRRTLWSRGEASSNRRSLTILLVMPDRIRVACVQMTSREVDPERERGRLPYVAQARDEEAVIVAVIGKARMREIRAKRPLLANRQADAYRWPTARS